MEELKQIKSTRTYDEWKKSLRRMISKQKAIPMKKVKVKDEIVKVYYDQCLMPDVCFKELFNR